MHESLSRRRTLGAMLSTGLAGLAGCSGSRTGGQSRDDGTTTESSRESEPLHRRIPQFSRDAIAVKGVAAFAAVPRVLAQYDETADRNVKLAPRVFSEHLSLASADLLVSGFDRAFAYVAHDGARDQLSAAASGDPADTYEGFDRYETDDGHLGIADDQAIYATDSRAFTVSGVELFQHVADAAAGNTKRGPVDNEDVAAVTDAVSGSHYLLVYGLFGDETFPENEDMTVTGGEAAAFGLTVSDDATATARHAVRFPASPDRDAFANNTWFGPIQATDQTVTIDGETAVAETTASLSERTPTTRKSAEHAVKVVGEQWKWTFSLVGEPVTQTGSFTLPVGVPIEFRVTSKDVNHGLMVQGAGVSVEANPDAVTRVVATFDEPGQYLAFCNVICGEGHGGMDARIDAVPPDEFAAWVENQG